MNRACFSATLLAIVSALIAIALTDPIAKSTGIAVALFQVILAGCFYKEPKP